MTDLPTTPNSQTPSATGAPGTPPTTTARLRGAVDLSALASQQGTTAAPAQGSGKSPAKGFVVDITEQTFAEIVQTSADVPVVVALYTAFSPQSTSMVAMLENLAAALAGRILLARADIEAFPQLAQAFGVQGVPAVVALIKGQPVPLFTGELTEPEARQYLDELLRVARAHGVTGTVAGSDAATPGPAETELPPWHQEAIAAIDQGNLAAAAEAYRKALAEKPNDADAKAGLAQVALMQRTDGLEAAQAEAVRVQAAEQPDDLEAQLAVADLDLLGGHAEDALRRVVDFIATHPGAPEERERARVRVLELFEIVGLNDPRVAQARQALARALF